MGALSARLAAQAAETPAHRRRLRRGKVPAEIGQRIVGLFATGAELADAGTGRRLWGRAVNTERPMGSLTKVMTALVVIRAAVWPAPSRSRQPQSAM